MFNRKNNIMKSISKVLSIFGLATLLYACKDDRILVTYPESYPVFDMASVAEATITYGDSISLEVELSDEGTPLSTLEVLVVVNKEVIETETIRTKGNTASVQRKYAVPFEANRPDLEPVKVYLSSINVDGYTTDTILSTTVARRPPIDELWFVPTTGNTYPMTLVDAEKLIYKSEGMDFGNRVTFRMATRLDKFKRVDWSGLVFGMVGDGVGVIDQSGEPLTSDEPSLVGITEMTFDALAFTVEAGGKLLEPFTALDIQADLSPLVMASKDFRGGNIYFGTGVEVTFTGLNDLSNNLAPDLFEVTGEHTAVFVGPTAIYKAYYYVDGNYLYVEPLPEVIYPEAMWVCGTGFGRPSAPYETTSSWNWNSPFDYAPAVRMAEGIYQVTFFGRNRDDDGDGFGTLDFKFFFKRGWWDAAHEIDAAQYTLTEPFFGRTDSGNTGNVNGGSTPFEGVFRVTLDENEKTITIETIN